MRNFLLTLALLASATLAAAEDWPAGYILRQGSNSPDDHYGIIIPDGKTAPDDETKATAYLVNLKTHHQLGELAGVMYWDGREKHTMSAEWSKDGTWAVLSFSVELGFRTLSVIEVKGDTFVQTDLGEHIRKTLPPESTPMLFTRLSPGRKLRLRIAASDDPEHPSAETAHCAFFQGSYDVAAHQWLSEETHPLTSAQYSTVSGVYEDLGREENGSSPKNAERVEFLDEQLADTYKTLEATLPAERLAKLKPEQAAWLKTRQAARTNAARCRLLETRIKTLEALLW